MPQLVVRCNSKTTDKVRNNERGEQLTTSGAQGTNQTVLEQHRRRRKQQQMWERPKQFFW